MFRCMVTRLDAPSRADLLRRFCPAIASCDTLESVLKCIDEVVRGFVRFERLYLYLKRSGDRREQFISLADGILGRSDFHSKSVMECLIRRLSEQEICSAIPFSATYANTTCTSFALTVARRCVGAILFLHPTSMHISECGMLLLQEITLLAAPSVDQIVHTQASGEKSYSEVLLAINRVFATTASLSEMLHRISAILRKDSIVDSCGFILHDTPCKTLRWAALDLEGRKESKYLGTTSPVDYGYPTSTAFLTRRPALLTGTDFANLMRKNRRGRESDIWLDEGAHTTVAIPLVAQGSVLGIFNASHNHPDLYHSRKIRLLTELGDPISLAVQNVIVLEELNRFKAHTRDTSVSVSSSASSAKLPQLIGRSAAIRDVIRQAEIVARTDTTVLLSGETGTGKEIVARTIHNLSRRNNGPFIKVNCAAIPSTLLESEFFGHEKGAYTGAVSQGIGRMELANNGTLLLDEIGDMPIELQPKLLRVLQEREFERVGGTRPIRVDIRIIAATNRSLQKEVCEGRFRADLFYRLNTFPILIPPLRKRREDIPLLISHFVREISERLGREIENIPPETLTELAMAYWPGNVRELQNVIERAVILSTGRTLECPALEENTALPGTPSDPGSDLSNLYALERKHILRVLRENKGFVARAAVVLGLKRTSLNSRMRRLGITSADLRDLRYALRPHRFAPVNNGVSD